jgi:hypothetical protein
VSQMYSRWRRCGTLHRGTNFSDKFLRRDAFCDLPTGSEDLKRHDLTPVLGSADLKRFDIARTPNPTKPRGSEDLKRIDLPTGSEDLKRHDLTPVLGSADLKRFDIARTPNSTKPRGSEDLKRIDLPTGSKDLKRHDLTPVLGSADLKRFDVARTPNSTKRRKSVLRTATRILRACVNDQKTLDSGVLHNLPASGRDFLLGLSSAAARSIITHGKQEAAFEPSTGAGDAGQVSLDEPGIEPTPSSLPYSQPTPSSSHAHFSPAFGLSSGVPTEHFTTPTT